jgi:deazaflavin-dependent oxidoreductase (nitroreductase family)
MTRVQPFNRAVVEEFRANAGKVGGMFEGGDLLLLTTVGARTGAEQTSPLAYVRDGDRLLVVGSAAGADHHPAWYHNLLAHPMVRVELGAETFGAVAVPAEGAERDRLFAAVVAVAPGYADYQDRTERVLPVVKLEGRFVDGPVVSFADKLLEIHTWLREQLRHVRVETEAHLAGQATGIHGAGQATVMPLGLQIRQHCLALCQGLEGHHKGEDAGLFPGMRARYPELADAIDRLTAEHRVVAGIQDELVRLLDDLATADPETFRVELERLAGELEAHLAYEEKVLLPLLGAPWGAAT